MNADADGVRFQIAVTNDESRIADWIFICFAYNSNFGLQFP